MEQPIVIDPHKGSARSPRLFMQFMEPLGATDSSVEAGWEFPDARWNETFLETIRDLAPGCIRWGGIYSSFWKWREGVGPRSSRVPADNLLWRGTETSQVGVHEIVDLCTSVGAEPLMAINFAGDGRPAYVTPKRGPSRAGDSTEAADLVSYCNDPDHSERRSNGEASPFAIKLWQIGNETSYPPAGQRFTRDENARHFVKFATAMKSRDPSIELIGWGDAARNEEGIWATSLLAEAGELADYVAVHMMNQRPPSADTVLRGRDYMDDRPRAWEELQEIYQLVTTKLGQTIAAVRGSSSRARIAITEGHLSLQPHNTSLLLYEWLAGLYSARVMNLYERHADIVEVATLADFFGNRWTVNAVMLGGPRDRPFLMPAGTIAKWYRRSGGTHCVDAPAAVGTLDISASRDDQTLYLHVVNTDLQTAATHTIQAGSAGAGNALVRSIAPERIDAYVDSNHPNAFEPTEAEVEVRQGSVQWTFPPASVTLMEIPLSSDTKGRGTHG